MNTTQLPAVRSRVTPLRALLGGTYVPRHDRTGRRAHEGPWPRADHRNTLSDSSQIEGSPRMYSRGTLEDV
jgi:hypothetical protein